MDAFSTKELPKEAVLQSAQLILRNPKILYPFYRNAVMLIGIAFAASIVGGGISAAYNAPALIGLIFLLIGCYAWILTAVALATIVLCSISYWRGTPITLADARRSMRSKMFHAMWGDVSGAAQFAFVVLLAFLPVLAPRVIARLISTQKGSGVASFATFANPAYFTAVLVGTLVGAIFCAFTALALRKIVLTDIAPGRALLSAYEEIRASGDVYGRLIGFVAAMNFALIGVQSTLSRNILPLDMNASAVASTLPSLIPLFIGAAIIGTIASAMQLLPFVWAAEHLEGRTELPTIAASPKGTGTGVFAKVALGIGIGVIALLALFVGSIAYVWHITGLSVERHQTVAFATFGITGAPAGYTVESNYTTRIAALDSSSDLLTLVRNSPEEQRLVILRTPLTGARSDFSAAAGSAIKAGCSPPHLDTISVGSNDVLAREQLCTQSGVSIDTEEARLRSLDQHADFMVSLTARQTALDTKTFIAVLRRIAKRTHGE